MFEIYLAHEYSAEMIIPPEGHRSYNYYLIWYNYRVTFRQVFASDLQTAIAQLGKHFDFLLL